MAETKLFSVTTRQCMLCNERIGDELQVTMCRWPFPIPPPVKLLGFDPRVHKHFLE